MFKGDEVVKLESINTFVVSFPLSHYVSGFRPILNRTVFIVLVRAGDRIGIGESTLHSGSIYKIYKKLSFLSKRLKHLHLEEALDTLRKIELKEFENKTRHLNYEAYLALESAMIDVASKHYERSIAEILGGIYREEIPVAGSIFLKHPMKMGEDLENWIRKGVKHIKFKVPKSLSELEVLLKTFRSILSKVGADDIVLRCDANQCFETFEKAFKAMKVIEKFGVHIIEQPMPKHSLKEISRLRKIFAPNLKIMLDESLETPRDIETFASSEVADIINIHPPKMGCLTITRDTILEIMRLGLEVNIGSALMTEIGLTHYLNLAASLPKLQYPLEEIGLFNLYGYNITDKPNNLAITDGKINVCHTIRIPRVMELKKYVVTPRPPIHMLLRYKLSHLMQI